MSIDYGAYDKPVLGITLSGFTEMQMPFDGVVSKPVEIANSPDSEDRDIEALSTAQLGHAMPFEFEGDHWLEKLWAVGLEARAFTVGFCATEIPNPIKRDVALLEVYQMGLNSRESELRAHDLGGPPLTDASEYKRIATLACQVQSLC